MGKQYLDRDGLQVAVDNIKEAKEIAAGAMALAQQAMESGGPSYRYFYTTGTDDITDVCSSEYITSWLLETYTNCQITYSGGTLRIYNETEGIDMTFNEHDTMPLACFALINPTS